MIEPLWRTVWRFLEKLEIKPPYDPTIPLLGIHTKERQKFLFLLAHSAPFESGQLCVDLGQLFGEFRQTFAFLGNDR